MTHIKFGTDGWRAIIADDFTFDNIEKIAQANADYWGETNSSDIKRRVIVGYDSRFLSDKFAIRASEVFAGNGYEVFLSKYPCATPAISLAVKKHSAVGGVVFTASHNPPIFNGYKMKSKYGGPASVEESREVEARIGTRATRYIEFSSSKNGSIVLIEPRKDHIKIVKKMVDFEAIANSRLRIAHDAMFGTGSGYFEEILCGTKCKVTSLNARRDVLFGGINPEPVTKNYWLTSAWLKKNPQDICLVNDGDADRIGAMDGRGMPLTAHQIICLLLVHLIKNRQQKGRMVKAITTTSMVDKICAEYGLELIETRVGFRHICHYLVWGDVLMGAEESGSIGFADYIPERDGILAGLMLLEMLSIEKKSINKLLIELEKRYGAHFYKRLDIHFKSKGGYLDFEKLINASPSKLMNLKIVKINTLDGVKYICADGAWLMIRASGTEPLARVYAEAQSQADADKLVKIGARLVKKFYVA